MAKITYENKEFLNKNENIADKNKVNDTDLNQIKEVVNENYDDLINLIPITLFETEKTYSSVANDTVITLNDDITNYKRVIIYGITSDNSICNAEIYKPQVNDKIALKFGANGNRSGYYAYQDTHRLFSISSNTTIKYETGTYLTAHTVSQNNIQGFVADVQLVKIYAVIGFKN